MRPPEIPEAWGALLSREQLRAYLGDICEATLLKICPVAPVDLGANVLRYRRAEVDAWLAGLAHRLPRARRDAQDAGQTQAAPARPLDLRRRGPFPPAHQPGLGDGAVVQGRGRRMTALPNIALSINQPWGFLVASGLKDIENRNWNTSFRGEFLIHVGLSIDLDCLASLHGNRHPVTDEPFVAFAARESASPVITGGMVGVAEVVDVITLNTGGREQPWFVGRYGLVIANARPIEFIPCVGALGFFKPDYSRAYKPKPERKARAVASTASALDLFS